MTTSAEPLSQLELDELWDVSDPVASQRSFADAVLMESDEARRAELTTQQARALGMQRRFDEAEALLDDVPLLTPAVQVRVLLERGRVCNSSGRPADAAPLFARATVLARANALTFLTIDALHMQAIAEPDAVRSYTLEGLAMLDATDDARTKRWGVALHNNFGWALHDAAKYDEALAEFEAAHRASVDYGTQQQEFIARWAIARCLRTLGRYPEALAIQQQLAIDDPTDEHVMEELAELQAPPPSVP